MSGLKELNDRLSALEKQELIRQSKRSLWAQIFKCWPVVLVILVVLDHYNIFVKFKSLSGV